MEINGGRKDNIPFRHVLRVGKQVELVQAMLHPREAHFLGYNPMSTLLPLNVQKALPAAKRATLLGHNFFPNLISYPMSVGLHSVFYLSVVMCLVAALVSLLRGKAQIVTRETQVEAVQPNTV